MMTSMRTVRFVWVQRSAKAPAVLCRYSVDGSHVFDWRRDAESVASLRADRCVLTDVEIALPPGAPSGS